MVPEWANFFFNIVLDDSRSQNVSNCDPSLLKFACLAYDGFMKTKRTIFISLALGIVCNQAVLATDNKQIDAPLEPLLKAAQQKRPEIWTKEIPDIKELRHAYSALFSFMTLYAGNNKVVSIEKSGSNWVKDLRNYSNTHPYASNGNLMLESSRYRRKLVDFSDEKTVDTIEQQCPPPEIEKLLPPPPSLPLQAN